MAALLRPVGIAMLAALSISCLALASSEEACDGTAIEVNDLGQETYGTDVSWAIHGTNLSDRLGDKQTLYDNFMQGCIEASIPCKGAEDARLNMNRLQPISVRNFTEMGYEKIRAPREVFAKIRDFYDKHRDQEVIEWHTTNPYHNMWEAPPTMINLQNETLDGGGPSLMVEIWDSMKDLLQGWTRQALVGCSLWGIRIYHEGSILTPHVDRFPLIASAIINIDQDVLEPWPLEVYGRDGKARNITMEPGDMILYESHSTIHGRPFPMKGNYFANVFIHFEQVGAMEYPDGVLDDQETESIEDGLPPYLVKDSPWAEKYKEEHPNGWELGSNPIAAAQRGDVAAMRAHSWIRPEGLFEKDENGWQPFHESARRGNTEMLMLLMGFGQNVNEVTNYGQGYTALKLCVDAMGESHSACQYLKSVGGLYDMVAKKKEGDEL